ncbi:MAG: 2-oxoacid:acceptor oxidoreductase family protein [Desulfotomaculales bacterium]
MARPVKIILAGEGGQGVQAVAEILAEAAYGEGKEALYIPNFGVEQRGGVSVAFLQVADERVGAPKFQTGDVVVALSRRAVSRTKQYVGKDTVFLYDANIEVTEEDLPRQAKKIMAIPAVELAKNELHPRVFNVVILGVLVRLTGVVSEEDAKKALEDRLKYKFDKEPELRELNYKAIERGMGLVAAAG